LGKTGKPGNTAPVKEPKVKKEDTDKNKADVSEECPKDTSEDAASINRVESLDKPTECEKVSSTPCSVLSYSIQVTVKNVCRYLLDHKKTGSDQPKRRQLVLFLDDRPLKEIGPEPVSRDKKEGTETFRVELAPNPADEKQRAEWAHVLMKAYRGNDNDLAVSLGLPESEPISKAKCLVLMVPSWTLPAILTMAGLGLLIIVLAVWKPLVRDSANGPFSLSKCQMAWWFYLVIAAWVCTAALMLSPTTITKSALVLMGISAATGLSASAIDKNQKAAAPAAAVKSASSGIFTDLVTDRQGEMTVHRFQMMTWTIVLGIYFIYHVWTTMSMPDFDNNLLILMGISSGTYVGVKTQEK